MAKKEKSVQTSAPAEADKPKASTEQILKELQSKANAHSMHGGQAEFYKHRLEVEQKLAQA